METPSLSYLLSALRLQTAPCVLPTSWSVHDKQPIITLAANNTRALYTGSGASDAEAASVRANASISPALGLYYFECTVVSKGREGYIAIGVCGKSFALSKLVGWDKHSYGYHGDDGMRYRESGSGTPYGPGFTTGDVIGCVVHFQQRSIGFTRNGKFLGIAFPNITETNPLYPAIGMRTPNECVEVNFGTKPFVFDFASYVASTLDALHRQSLFQLPLSSALPSQAQYMSLSSPNSQPASPAVLNAPVASPSSCASDFSSEPRAVHTAILSELVHRGYARSAEAFARAVGLPCTSAQIQDMAARKAIREAIVLGNIEQALMHIAVLGRQLPADVEGELLAIHFIELVRKRQVQDAVAFGRSYPILAKTGVYALLAYADPLSSASVAHYFDASRRLRVAEKVNDAVGPKGGSLLERTVRQWHVVCQYLTCQDVESPSGACARMVADACVFRHKLPDASNKQ